MTAIPSLGDWVQNIDDTTARRVLLWMARNTPASLRIARRAYLAEQEEHLANCDGSITAAGAGFGGQDMTYECFHPAHRQGPKPGMADQTTTTTTIFHVNRWCGKFMTIAPGVQHDRKDCGY
jgi:hypothetical protein